MSDSPIKPEWRVIATSPPELSETHKIYALLETELWPEWRIELYKTTKEPQYAMLFDGTRFSSISNGPVLIDISESAEMLQRCCEVLTATPGGSVIVTSSKVGLQELLQSLRNSLIVLSNNNEAIFRFYDPRTMLPMLAAMTDDERAQMFAPVRQFIWHHKVWLSADIPHTAELKPSQPWEITSTHIQHMQSILQQWSRSFKQ